MNVRKLNNAVVLPGCDLGLHYGGVVDESGEFVAGTDWQDMQCPHVYEYDEKKVVFRDETVIYIGCLSKCWGHVITDSCKKLWYLNTEEAQQLLAQGVKMVYITVGNEKLPQYAQTMLQAAGVDMSLVEWIHETPIRFKEVIIPDSSFYLAESQSERVGTPEYLQVINHIKNYAENVFAGKVASIDKIYFTRTAWTAGKDNGEQAVEELFAKHGYKIIAPEKIDTIEQIYLLAHCKEFVSTEGSIGHNSVFCSPETKVAILKKADYENSYQLAINRAIGFDFTYIYAHHSVRANEKGLYAGPFYVYPTKQLMEYLGEDMALYVPYWKRWSYWMYWIKEEKWVRKGRHFVSRTMMELSNHLSFKS